jgi:hypothetical protein
MHNLIGLGIRAAMHHQHELVATNLQQQFSFGAGRLNHHNRCRNPVPVRRNRQITRTHAVTHRLPISTARQLSNRPQLAAHINLRCTT